MKRNNHTPRVIFVSGLPGTGKTTFAEHLAKKVKAVHLNTDKIRRDYDLLGQYDSKTKKAVYNKLLEQLQHHLNRKRTVIVDSTFHSRQSRAPFIDLVHDMNIPYFWVVLKAEDESIEKRMQKKRKYSEANFEVYLKLKHQQDPIEEAHLTFWTDEKKMKEMTARVEHYLNEIHALAGF